VYLRQIPQSSVSIVVQDITAAKPILALNAATPRNPASTIKLLTTWLALEKLNSQVGLKLSHLLSYRSLCQIKFFCCQAKVQVPCGCIKHS
jgi:D-alanyl-D-alanine carboxypeptidase